MERQAIKQNSDSAKIGMLMNKLPYPAFEAVRKTFEAQEARRAFIRNGLLRPHIIRVNLSPRAVGFNAPLTDDKIREANGHLKQGRAVKFHKGGMAGAVLPSQLVIQKRRDVTEPNHGLHLNTDDMRGIIESARARRNWTGIEFKPVLE